MNAALDILARRACSSGYLRRRLSSRFGEEAARAAVDRVVELRLIDDDAYAETYARDRFARGGYGRSRVEKELLDRGVASGVASRAVDAAIDPGCERERAARLLDRFFARSGRDRDCERDRAAAWRHLAVRGYAEDLINELLGAY